MHIVRVNLSYHVVLHGQQQMISLSCCRLLKPSESSRYLCQNDSVVTSSMCTVE